MYISRGRIWLLKSILTIDGGYEEEWYSNEQMQCHDSHLGGSEGLKSIEATVYFPWGKHAMG